MSKTSNFCVIMCAIVSGVCFVGAGVYTFYPTKPAPKNISRLSTTQAQPSAATANTVDKPKQIGPVLPGFKASYIVSIKIGWMAPDAPGPPLWDGYTITVNWNGAYWEGVSADGQVYTQVMHSIDELAPLNVTDVGYPRALALGIPYALVTHWYGNGNNWVVVPHQGKRTVPPQYLYRVTIQ